MDCFNIREANLADKDAILAINDNVYDGLDYLKGLFDYFMTCANVTGYVGEKNDTVIAFGISFVVDDGYTVISRSGRVSPKYAGQGIYSRLQKHVLKSSGAMENSFTTLNINPAVFLDSFQRENELIVSKDMSRYSFSPKNVPTKLPTQEQLKQVSEHDLKAYMLSDVHRKYLFPHEVIIVDWVPYRLLPSNIPLIGMPERTNKLSNVDVNEGNQTGLLSFITVVPTQYPPHTLVLDIYGSDTRCLDTHIAAQINFIRERTDGDVCCLIFYEECLGKDVVENSFARLGMKKEDGKLLANTGLPSLKQMVFRKLVK